MIPGEIICASGTLTLNAGRTAVTVTVANTGDRPVQVGSHYHFFEVNSALRFDRGQAHGMRLDIAAGTAVRFEPGQSRDVKLIPLSGSRHVYGFQGRIMGALEAPKGGRKPARKAPKKAGRPQPKKGARRARRR